MPTTASGTDARAEDLKHLFEEVLACQRCPLHKTRTRAVLHDGSPYASLLFVGEAPGRDEDLQGVPFVGKAGQLLTRMIEAMGLKRSEVYICNVLKDRPPENRTPLPEEMIACLPFLQHQIAVVQPKVICSLGSIATKALLKTEQPITRLRGSVYDYQGIPVVPTFHPSYLLRNPEAKREAWRDLQVVMGLLGLRLPA
jgi:DNA polymerase